MRSLEFSLERLGLDHIDIVYAHDLDAFTHGSKEASDARIREFMAGGYKALAKLREGGAVKAIGAGINEWEVAETLARSGDFDIFMLAGRYTLLEQEALQSFPAATAWTKTSASSSADRSIPAFSRPVRSAGRSTTMRRRPRR